MLFTQMLINYIAWELMCHEAMMEDLECLNGYEAGLWADQERFESELLRCTRPYTQEEDAMDRIPF